MRYMDDMVILCPNKRTLRNIRDEIIVFLRTKLHLTIKHSWQLFPLCHIDGKTFKTKGCFIDYMGFKFYNNRTTLRKSTLCRVRRKANQIAKRHRLHQKINWYIATQMISKVGWLYHCKTYKYYINNIKHKVNVHAMRQIVSNHSKHIHVLSKKGMSQYAA